MKDTTDRLVVQWFTSTEARVYAQYLLLILSGRDPAYNGGNEVILRPVQNNVWTYGQYVPCFLSVPWMRERTLSYPFLLRVSYMRIMQVHKLSPTEFEESEVSEIWPINRSCISLCLSLVRLCLIACICRALLDVQKNASFGPPLSVGRGSG